MIDSANLVHVIQSRPRKLIDDLNAELRTNLGTSHYHRLSEEEFRNRHSHIFQSLADWLTSADKTALRKDGEDLGSRRFQEATPLGQVVLALILIEKHLCAFLGGSEQVEQETREAITRFFQIFTYYTAKGYESALAVSNRMARYSASGQPSATAVAGPPRKEAAKSGESDMEISRGGQVGELGG